MGKRLFVICAMLLVTLLSGTVSSQGMGDQKAYDWMGTPVISSDHSSLKTPDYLNPYTAGRPEWDPYGPGSSPLLARPEWDPYGADGIAGYGASSVQIEPADPVSEGLTARGAATSLSNQLYIQRGTDLLAESSALLGEPYILWARVAGRGSFLLYDYNHLILKQGYVTPGWYKITGVYADYLGQHLYRVVSSGFYSNNLTVLVDSGGYPTTLSLTGLVVDQNGHGVPGAKVIISNNEGGKFTTTTRASGYYAIDVATGTYLVNAELEGYVFTPTTVQVWSGMVSAARPVVGRPAAT